MKMKISLKLPGATINWCIGENKFFSLSGGVSDLFKQVYGTDNFSCVSRNIIVEAEYFFEREIRLILN
jgi:hypothetical protein